MMEAKCWECLPLGWMDGWLVGWLEGRKEGRGKTGNEIEFTYSGRSEKDNDGGKAGGAHEMKHEA